MTLFTQDFDFHLPPDLVAQKPAHPRDSARLLDGRKTGAIEDCHIYDLPHILHPGDLIVVNDTRVIHAQLHGYRGQARIGITLDQPHHEGGWRALIKNSKRLHIGDIITFEGCDIYGKVKARHPGGVAILQFSCEGEAFEQFLHKHAALALPPYIARPQGPTKEDEKDYQTIFSHYKGAVAAPTAGLHFTPALTDALKARDIHIETVTLHVGAGTFLPVREDDARQHQIHSEYGIVTQRAAQNIQQTRQRGGRIVAIGTTTLRILESAANDKGDITPFKGDTSIFILPGYQFKVVDLLMTNFHLPRSTLFMLVCAFCGTRHAKSIYQHAIDHHYRFYSYGDACLLQCTHPRSLFGSNSS